mgnify:FL=1
MRHFWKIILIFIILPITTTNFSFADTPYYIDFSKVLNESKAGKGAQDYLKKKFESENKKFNKEGEELKKEETEIISQKKLITNEEYQKKVEVLRKKVASLQKRKQDLIKDVATLRAKARTELLKTLNPIIKKYMEDNKIRIVLDRKSILLGDVNLDITPKIIELLNKELKSIKLN